MAIFKKQGSKNEKIFIDLSGPDGNVFYLLGMVEALGRQISLSKEEIESIRKNMMSSDYENAITVFDKQFGDFVDLYR